jgi:quinol monooxygenase YgiN
MAKPSMFVKLSAQPGKRDELLAAFAPMLEAVGGEPGTLVYTIHTDNADEDAIWVFELYADDEALAAHSSSAAMKALMGTMGPLLVDAMLASTTSQGSSKGVDS